MYPSQKPSHTVNIVAVLIAVLCISAVGFAETNNSPIGSTTLSIAQQRLRTKVTYSCTEMPIETALKELASQANIYIVKSPEVTGNVSIEVVAVPLEEVLTNVLAAYNYSFVATETMIRVVALPESAALREKLLTKIYKITYADVSELALSLQTFISMPLGTLIGRNFNGTVLPVIIGFIVLSGITNGVVRFADSEMFKT